MIFASSDVPSLLHRWEVAEYVSEIFVIVGCAGELVADFFTRIPEKARKHIGTWSTIVLILALTIGLKCLIKTNELSGSVIGSLGDKAEEAGRKANTATTNSETALAKSGKALDVANGAEKTAGKAQTIAGSVANKAANLDRQLGDTKKDLNTARKQLADAETAEKREEQVLINMAVCNAPRAIGLGPNGETIGPLKPFAGRHAVIEFLPDAETWRAAGIILATLRQAGWQVDKFVPLTGIGDEGIADGVSVQPFFVPHPETGRSPTPEESKVRETDWESHLQASDAANTLVDFLHSWNWQARWDWPKPVKNDIPHDGLKVRVGLPPVIWYVAPPAAQGFEEAAKKSEETRRQFKKEDEEDAAKREAAILKGLTPQQAAIIKAEWERNKVELEAERKLENERQSGPCQPLSRFAGPFNP